MRGGHSKKHRAASCDMLHPASPAAHTCQITPNAQTHLSATPEPQPIAALGTPACCQPPHLKTLSAQPCKAKQDALQVTHTHTHSPRSAPKDPDDRPRQRPCCTTTNHWNSATIQCREGTTHATPPEDMGGGAQVHLWCPQAPLTIQPHTLTPHREQRLRNTPNAKGGEAPTQSRPAEHARAAELLAVVCGCCFHSCGWVRAGHSAMAGGATQEQGTRQQNRTCHPTHSWG